jgi:phospholipid transport system substrate-binding protein
MFYVKPNNMSAKVNRILLAAFAAVLFISAAAAPAEAQTDRAREIRTLLEQRDRQIKGLLGTKTTFTAQERQNVAELINGVIDFEAMAATALGTHWTGLTAQQRKDFVDVFSQIVRNQSLSDLDIYRTRVTYGQVTVEGNNARAVTQVTYKEVPATVEYTLGFKNGQWYVTDIILDDVSTAQGYARSFQSVVRRNGFDALMTSLRRKLDQVTAAS